MSKQNVGIEVTDGPRRAGHSSKGRCDVALDVVVVKNDVVDVVQLSAEVVEDVLLSVVEVNVEDAVVLSVADDPGTVVLELDEDIEPSIEPIPKLDDDHKVVVSRVADDLDEEVVDPSIGPTSKLENDDAVELSLVDEVEVGAEVEVLKLDEDGVGSTNRSGTEAWR
ncbi:uncharacterized protein Z518_09665 [Rhinocladiella mackenziei CBS 650.93]|uniref:Rhinocladiella mackenziei CBS 650.93 unplaced genomic scaffold supercont1.8, whole genome shotgun sequence n=1 Tax=Rhinocladiella mackenziei CBS 650.93 TaxID=1442369 RepID=A0A0D2IV69_9EURO|nr:uncharacterized protein Z518_09665 [Rhinocladiella mackenziei CBS 650.93]KIX00600.1 hypothetical protein Z518_09665 [Rhinocladiella mackenziei CBS 650.93]